MKQQNTKYLYAIVFSLFTLLLNAQAVKYSYDPAGNRIHRKLYVCPTCPASGRESNPANQTKIDTATATKLGLNVYPNPTQEKLNLTIANLPNDKTAKIVMSDEQGKLILSQDTKDAQNPIDMTLYNPGIYFIKITIDNDIFHYKIVKVQ
jgi:hypothetical protein